MGSQINNLPLWPDGGRRLRSTLLRLIRLGPLWLLGGPLLFSAQPAAPPVLARVGVPVAERGTLRVMAGSAENFPYSFRDPNGQVTGFTTELIDAVVRVLNLRIERVYSRGGISLVDRFKEGEFDFLQSYSQTAERSAYADFSAPFLTLQGAIYVQKHGSPIKTLVDFNGRKFAVVGDGSTGAEFLRSRGLEAELVRVNTTMEALARVETGECAGTYISQLTGLSLLQQSNLSNLAQFGPVITDHDIRQCLAVHKGDVQLLARLNEGLAILHRTGEYGRIYQKWFGRLGSPLITREKVVSYAALALALALAATLWGFHRQRTLRHRLARQTEELAGQQALLRALYDNIPLAICVLEAEPAGPRVLAINRAAEAIFGTPAAQAAGRLLRELPLEAEWAGQFNGLVARGSGSAAQLREERLLGATGRRVIFTLVPMLPGAAGLPRLCLLVEDITERRNLDEEIAQSRKLRAVGELVGGIAHEFNNLLTPVMLQVDMIKEVWAHDARLIAETRVILECAQRAAELTRRLLMFGRKSDNVIEPVQVGEVVSSCFGLLRHTVERRIVWEQAVPPDLPPLEFNTTDLNQILLNLIINARDTLLEKLERHPGDWTPVIRIEARLLPTDALGRLDDTPSRRQILGWQRLTVRDNGMGMAPEVRERIFEPFYTTKAVGKGTGLGLATVWHLVTAVSGRIEVESKPGEGTAFHVYLPMLPSTGASGQVREPKAADRTASARIFLAEDDPQVAMVVIAVLRRDGHKVTHLLDGAVAWEHLQHHAGDYDLLILDVNMPGLDGLELAQRVRASGLYAGRLLIISGRLGSDDLRQIAAIRIDGVLNKPFDVGELLEAVRDSVRRGPK